MMSITSTLFHKNTPTMLSFRMFAMKTGIPTNGSMCNTENFVPIVVPGLSSSFSRSS